MSASPQRIVLAECIRAIPDFPKPGVLFRDITPLLKDPIAFRQAVREMGDQVRHLKVDLVAAAEARGFLFAAPLAIELEAGMVPIRKHGKLPYKTIAHTYELEYGSDTLEIHIDAIRPGANVLVVDDLLATGGTVDACCRLVEKAGGSVAGCLFLVELAGFGGVDKVRRYKTFSLIRCD